MIYQILQNASPVGKIRFMILEIPGAFEGGNTFASDCSFVDRLTHQCHFRLIGEKLDKVYLHQNVQKISDDFYKSLEIHVQRIQHISLKRHCFLSVGSGFNSSPSSFNSAERRSLSTRYGDTLRPIA